MRVLHWVCIVMMPVALGLAVLSATRGVWLTAVTNLITMVTFVFLTYLTRRKGGVA